MSEEKHHPLGPSSLERAYYCPGSVLLAQSEKEDDESSADANEGIMLHERVVSGVVDDLTAEQAELVRQCRERLEQFAPLDAWQFEAQLDLLDDEFNVLTFGTVDALFDDVENDRVIIFDWKFGRIPVTQANDNMQLWSYAACALEKTGRSQAITHIYQPRIKHLTDGVFDQSIQARVKDCINEILESHKSGIILRYNEKTCKYCSAMLNCPEYRRNVALVANQHTTEITDPDAIANYLVIAKQVKKWAQNLEHRAKYMMQFEKVEIPGWCLRSSAGSREITDTQAVYQATVGEGILTHDEFMSLIDVKIGKLEDAYAKARKAKDNTPLVQAKRELGELLKDVVIRKSDSYTLAQKKGA